MSPPVSLTTPTTNSWPFTCRHQYCVYNRSYDCQHIFINVNCLYYCIFINVVQKYHMLLLYTIVSVFYHYIIILSKYKEETRLFPKKYYMLSFLILYNFYTNQNDLRVIANLQHIWTSREPACVFMPGVIIRFPVA